jgi:hypothetical protein
VIVKVFEKGQPLPDMEPERLARPGYLNEEGEKLAAAATPLTRSQAAIVTCFTGMAACPMRDFHALAEHLMGAPIWTHEFADKKVWEILKEKAKPLFLALCTSDDKGDPRDDCV